MDGGQWSNAAAVRAVGSEGECDQRLEEGVDVLGYQVTTNGACPSAAGPLSANGISHLVQDVVVRPQVDDHKGGARAA